MPSNLWRRERNLIRVTFTCTQQPLKGFYSDAPHTHTRKQTRIHSPTMTGYAVCNVYKLGAAVFVSTTLSTVFVYSLLQCSPSSASSSFYLMHTIRLRSNPVAVRHVTLWAELRVFKAASKHVCIHALMFVVYVSECVCVYIYTLLNFAIVAVSQWVYAAKFQLDVNVWRSVCWSVMWCVA